MIGRVKRDFTVPEMPGGRSNEPLDLGTITVKLEALQIGDLAPDFDVERIGTPEKGRRVKLSDYRGKLVLLDFWAGWQDDMTVLKEVQKKFGSDPRFVLISLCLRREERPRPREVHQREWTELDERNWRRSRLRSRRALQDPGDPEPGDYRSGSQRTEGSADVPDRSRWANRGARPARD